MGTNMGVTASPPGCSAEPGPISVVPAVPVSIPNAMRDLSCGIERYISTFIPATRELNGFSEDGIARKVLVGIALALISAASAIEAAAAGETAQTGSTEGESAVAKPDAQTEAP